MYTLTQFNREQRDLETFSGRLNALMDLTGKFVSLADGRASQLAKQLNISRTSAHFWLNSNKTPHRNQLATLVEGLLVSINANVSLESVMAWLEYGSAVHNPFVNPHVSDNQEMGAIFIAMLSEARKLGIVGIDGLLSESDSNEIIRITLDAMLKTPPPRVPDLQLIQSLLRKYTKR